MESKRQLKFSRMIQKELGEIFQRNLTHQLGSMMISVTHVQMSPDLSLARIHLSFIMTEDASSGFEKVDNYKSGIRRELGKRIGKQVRIVPELAFFLDDSAGYANKMDEIIDNLNIPSGDDTGSASTE
jgi:ribosome-binding factor A